MTLDDLIPAHVTATVAEQGLHKIAGAMLGVPELSVKEAVAVIGMKAYLRRKEARAIVDGIAAYATLTNEKVAENPALMALLRRAAIPAAAGAGIATIPHLMSQDPQEHSLRAMLPSMGIGALVGGAGGGLAALGSATSGGGAGLGQDLAANLLRSSAP